MCDQTFLLSNMAPQVEDLPLQLGSSSLSGGEGVQQGQVGALGTVCEEAYKTLQVRRWLTNFPDLLYCICQFFRNVYVCTGPLYLPHMEADGKMYVKYQVSQVLPLCVHDQ